MAIESLAQQTSVFVDSMNLRLSSAEKTADENAQEAKTPAQGDTVTISEEARAIIAMEKQDQSGQTDEESDMDQTIQTLKDQIEKLEQEIKDLEDKPIPEAQKRTQIQDKETRLMELRDQLVKAQQTKLKIDGQTLGGGTSAEGFGNSVASF
ncbi:hypothetical protein [Pseudodesulfovibrio portus]|uniref:FlxA-like protein n=1 Tax=Pseudodesulfovibrio portus TaxID=231439 RepID=A0ABN6RSN5_9BACT|nr:hypothetical protein [Pseudodesulfovibrio portus]BDQ34104.1 hypothetical protein JCM14722_16460 [Pseudodesulfovibrio portus]